LEAVLWQLGLLSDQGSKMVAYAQEILLDVADAVELTKGEEITLMYWGNAIVKETQKDSAGKVTHVVGELHLEGDPKNTAKKLHWLAKVQCYSHGFLDREICFEFADVNMLSRATSLLQCLSATLATSSPSRRLRRTRSSSLSSTPP
jgi:hypothetical protein